jgi:hypothetical protein
MQMVVVPVPEGRKGYSHLIKQEILNYWRASKGTVYYDEVRPHEMAQWNALEQRHGLRGLRLGHGSDMEHLRTAPPPTLKVRGEFKIGGKGRIRVIAVLDAYGQSIDTPLPLTPQERLLYHVVRELTILHGICTYADLAHALWPPNFALPDYKISAVVACKINSKLKRQSIVNVRGRGFRWINPQAK